MYRFGSHVSCAGGLLKGIDRGLEAGCDCIQVFVSSPRQWPTLESCIPVRLLTKNNNQWQCKPLSESDCTLFLQAVADAQFDQPIAHSSYLINVASPGDELWEKSLEALVVEWQRCEQLQLAGLVMHPGAHTSSTPEQGLERIVQAVQLAIARVQPKFCRLLLENTAGQGSCLGWQIEQLGWLLSAIDSPHVGVCWDTCHALAAGYDFRTAKGLKELSQQLEQHCVLERIAAIHVNDSKKDCGSRVDRHEHIGLGFIGEAGFRRFLRSSAFKVLPMYLETPKETDPESGLEWDVKNLATLRRLAGVSPRART